MYLSQKQLKQYQSYHTSKVLFTFVSNKKFGQLVKNDYQHTSKLLFTFVANKKFGQLVNIFPHAFTMRNTVNTEFSYVEVWFTDQSSKALEIEDNVNLTLIIG